jgi:hypothetical protein
MIYRNPNLKMGSNIIAIDEYTQQVTSADKVRQTIKELEKYLNN